MTPKTKDHEYEFGGPIGTAFMLIILPLLVLGITWLSMASDWKIAIPMDPLPSISDLWDIDTLKLVSIWILFQAFFYLSPLGRTVQGFPLKDGSRLSYNMNGLSAFVISSIGLGVCYHKDLLPITYVYDRFIQLAFASWLFSLILSTYLFTIALVQGTGYAEPGNSGNLVYDFFMGRQLNPRIGNLDLKVFFEMRPGLIGWVMINFCMAAKQYEKHGDVTTSMLLVCFFHFWYIFDALWNEEAILSTMDVNFEGFGFMLAFGDIVWVPFLYSLQARYLVDHPVDLPLWATIGILILQTIGYVIFRGSNSTKNEFRRDPNSPASKSLKTLTTDNGKKLIISGWWGMCRHPNYLGDLLMALSWCLPCGFGSILPYFYIIYFTILLIHREKRDAENCKQKHGKGWDKYCDIVKYRILPGVY